MAHCKPILTDLCVLCLLPICEGGEFKAISPIPISVTHILVVCVELYKNTKKIFKEQNKQNEKQSYFFSNMCHVLKQRLITWT